MQNFINQIFIDDFNLCMNYYGCTKKEAEFEKQRVLKDYYNAAKCYSVIAAGLRRVKNV